MIRSLLIAILLLSSAAARAEVIVFAAASLKEPIDRIVADFDHVVVSYGGSGTMARQVTLGAPADVVLLANVAWMDVLLEDGHVQSDTVQDFASNRLILVGPVGGDPILLEVDILERALGDGRLALGLTEAVPAGIYAKAALESLNLWDTVAPRLAEVDNVRSALSLVIRRQVPLGIVYQTDVRISDAITTLAVFPENSHPPIRYTAALTVEAEPAATEVLAAILAPAGQAILAEAGFLPPVAPDG